MAIERFATNLTEPVWAEFDRLVCPLDENYSSIEWALNDELQKKWPRMTVDVVAGFVERQRALAKGVQALMAERTLERDAAAELRRDAPVPAKATSPASELKGDFNE